MSESQVTSDAHGAAAHVPDVHGASQAVEGAHGSTADHGDGHGHDDHGHPVEALGPIDWPMWGVGVLGVVLALAVILAMVLATGFNFGA